MASTRGILSPAQRKRCGDP